MTRIRRRVVLDLEFEYRGSWKPAFDRRLLGLVEIELTPLWPVQSVAVNRVRIEGMSGRLLAEKDCTTR